VAHLVLMIQVVLMVQMVLECSNGLDGSHESVGSSFSKLFS
jgi:hypothetical protein